MNKRNDFRISRLPLPVPAEKKERARSMKSSWGWFHTAQTARSLCFFRLRFRAKQEGPSQVDRETSLIRNELICCRTNSQLFDWSYWESPLSNPCANRYAWHFKTSARAIEMCMDMKILVLDIIYQGLLYVYRCVRVCTLYVFYSVFVCISKVVPSQSTIAYTRATCIHIHRRYVVWSHAIVHIWF